MLNVMKNHPKEDKFTVTEVGTLIEELRSEFRIFGEDLISVKNDVGSLKEMVAENTEKIAVLEIAARNMATKSDLAILAAKIEKLIESIDKLIKTKTDREEFITLEKRVSALEARSAASSR